MGSPVTITPDPQPQNSAQPVTITPDGVGVASAQPSAGTKDWFKKKFYELTDKFLDELPVVGATGGAMIGGGAGTAVEPGGGTALGAIGGAGIGGMAGEAARQIGKHVVFNEGPQDTSQSANAISQQGVLQGGIQAAAEALPMAVAPLKKAAEKQYIKGLKPTTGENKAIASDITPEMIDRGIHGSTQDIEARATDEINKLRPQLNQAYSEVPSHALAKDSPISSTLTSLSKLKDKYTVDGNVVNPSAVNAIENTQKIIEQYGNNISPQSLRRIKQIFDESVSEAGGYTNNDLTTNYMLKSQKEAANRIREILHGAAPDAAALDKEMSFWLDIQQVSKATNLRTSGQEGGLLKTFTPLAAGAAGAAGLGVTHSTTEGLGAAAITALTGYVAQAAKTPAWRTASAVAKDRIAEAMARGDVRMTAVLLSRFGVQVPASLIIGPPRDRSLPEQQ
jgi:hypothetical protein